MNLNDYKIYIQKLCIMSNNYYIYDDKYIKNKYNINSYDKFRKFFKKYHSEKLIFNSEKSESFFIRVMNLDSRYMLEKYGNSLAQMIINFFILQNECLLNECDEFNLTNKKKIHSPNCKCKIKVKSIVNLSINALIFILIENEHSNKNTNTINSIQTNNVNIYNCQQNNICQITKLYNKESNKKIINSIKKIESIKKNLGINLDSIQYQLTDTIHEDKIFDNEDNKKNNLFNCEEPQNCIVIEQTQTQTQNHFDELFDNKVNLKKLNEQLISESLNLEQTSENNLSKQNIDNNNNNDIKDYTDNNSLCNDNLENNSSYYKNKVFKKTQDAVTNISNSDSDRFNNLSNFAQNFNNNKNSQFKIDDIESEKSEESNRFGNVIIKENKVKIEKKEPIDLNNSSDVMISYNDYDKKTINNNFRPVNNKIITSQSKSTSSETSDKLKNEPSNEELSEGTHSETNKTYINKEYNETINVIHPCKREVIEILNNLNNNFNYITSDDILIDKDKKMQICTFMVEIKYKIFGMFRQIEKEKIINSQYKSKIMNNYEKIYSYVVQSNKIGSTGEMIEFNKNKEIIRLLIEDIIQI